MYIELTALVMDVAFILCPKILGSHRNHHHNLIKRKQKRSNVFSISRSMAENYFKPELTDEDNHTFL